MSTFTTPGVYYQRVDASTPAISVIRTDVAGFVGIAPRGLLDTAVPVESWRQYQAHYGSFTGAGFLAYAVRAFFDNGGQRCWIVRVASNDPAAGANTSAVELPGTLGPIWNITASSPGVWGNNLSLEIRETHGAQTTVAAGWLDSGETAVATTTNFMRGTLARLTQTGGASILRVVSDVDAAAGTLIWMNPSSQRRLPYDQPITGLRSDTAILVESLEYTFIVREQGVPVAVYEGLALIPEHPQYGPALLSPLPVVNHIYSGGALPPPPNPIVINDVREVFTSLDTLALPVPQALAGGSDGMITLAPYDFAGEDVDPLDSDEVKAQKTRGFRVLGGVDEVSMLAIPDLNIQPEIPAQFVPPLCVPDPCLPAAPVAPPVPAPFLDLPPLFTDDQIYGVQADAVSHCELMGDRMMILDPPISASRNDQLGIGAIRAWRQRFDSTYAALYYPWTRVADPLRGSTGITRDIPPSGHVAGQYANADFTVGVQKAPANDALNWVQDVTAAVNATTHGILNSLGINAIRALAGRGIRIMGARTVSSNPVWRFVNVRRLMMMIEKALRLSTQWAVFEPNNVSTRAKIRLSIASFLISLWQQGALMGDTADQALRVRCDDTNNTETDIQDGRLTADVLVAPSNPFEFIVVRVGRVSNQFELQELGSIVEVH
jgi:uncharacterized protein